MSALTNLIDQYEAGAAALRAAVAGMSREPLVARPIAGKLSTLEVVCHPADLDPIHADRMKRVSAEERPSRVGPDDNRVLDAPAYHAPSRRGARRTTRARRVRQRSAVPYFQSTARSAPDSRCFSQTRPMPLDEMSLTVTLTGTKLGRTMMRRVGLVGQSKRGASRTSRSYSVSARKLTIRVDCWS